jgi:hypothetical protein
MQLEWIDWLVVIAYGIVTLVVGLFSAAARVAASSLFPVGAQVTLVLLGTSMVATTFSTDTPNLMTNLVRTRRSPPFGRSLVALFTTMRMIASLELPSAKSF